MYLSQAISDILLILHANAKLIKLKKGVCNECIVVPTFALAVVLCPLARHKPLLVNPSPVALQSPFCNMGLFNHSRAMLNRLIKI